ncbi:MAG: methyltransferase [Solobacterium sp.]|nr:methyltransferase [Solobacterium sp.]
MEAKHYFTDNRDLPSHRRELSYFFQGVNYVFTVDDGVFSKNDVDYGTHTLLKDAVTEPVSGSVLDLGCGYGVIGIVLKKTFPEITVTAVDINPRAVELAEANSTANGTPVEVLVSDGFEAIDDRSFHVIVTNPPIRAGKQVIYRMFEDAYAHLENGGLFLAVIRRNQGAESAMKKLAELFDSCDLADRDRGYWVLKCVKREN